MFMDNKQLKNSIELYKIRCRESRTSILILMAIPTFLFFLDFFVVITQVSNYNDAPVAFQLNTYSQSMLIPLMIFIGFLLFYYKKFNTEHEVFPQTNKSRFLSFLLYNYGLFLKVSVISLLLYLIQYGIISIIAKFNGNVLFAYDFSMTFVLWGFIVNLIYGFLAISLLIFIGVLDRKFGLIFRFIFGGIALLFLISANGNSMSEYIIKFVGFWTKEPSLILFTIKSVALWVIVSWLSWIINSNTVYYKSQSQRFPKWIAATVGLLSIFTIATATLFINNSNTNITSHQEISVSEEKYDLLRDGYTQIPLDCSTLNQGDVITIVTDFSPKNESMTVWTNTIDDFKLDAVDVEGLHISYKLPENVVNDVNLNSLSNPEITAKLEGTTLYINYSSDKNQKLLFLAPYSFMDQFEAYKDKNLYNSKLGIYRSSGWGDIRVISEKGIRVTPVFQN